MSEEAFADAPGRVNLIGEHTDYHEGYVLPAVIPQRTRVHASRRRDGRVHVSTAAFGGEERSYEIGREMPGQGWVDYVQGVTVILARRGIAVGGVDLHIESDVPVGAGVSSSAALEVSVLRALRALFALDFDDREIARLAHAVETDFVGAPVGVMDQFAVSLGREGEALFLDTRSLTVERLPLPRSIELVLIHSGTTHAHAGGQYVVRRRESFEAASLLGVERLRDLDLADLSSIATLPDTLARRARHVVTENARVLAAVAAVRRGDAVALGALFNASHASMRDDYETSTADIDRLVAIAQAHPEVHGARLTGGGFGGAVVMIVAEGRARDVGPMVCEHYSRVTGHRGILLIPAADC